MKTKDQLIQNFKARHGGRLLGQPKPAAAAAVPPLTAEQERILKEVIGTRPAAAGADYSGADFQSLVESCRDKRKCSYSDAYCAVLRTAEGQRAHKDFLRKKNPHIQVD